MTHWKTAHRSFYYQGAPEPADPDLAAGAVCLLVIDVQNTYLDRPAPVTLDAEGRRRFDAWTPFHARMRGVVIPTISGLMAAFRAKGHDVAFARIACLTPDGRDRSLSQKKPGWNNLLLPKDEAAAQIVPELAPLPGEIVVTKTTDSALTGTSLRLALSNMGVRTVVCVGIFTDQCISSTVRSLADESFDVVVVEDGCAAGSDELHARELEILNMIYCNVMSAAELMQIMDGPQ